MRTAYQESLDVFAHDLIIMCDTVSVLLGKASKALIGQSLQEAEDALSLSDDLNEIQARCTQRAIDLLVLEAPIARDLRQVISSIHIVQDFSRMGTLMQHTAKSARRRYPEFTVPEEYLGYFQEIIRLCTSMLGQIRDILIAPDPEDALKLQEDDDAVDDLHRHLMAILTTRPWKYTTKEAVDMALIARYFERFADHCVNVAAQIIFLVTGLDSSAYLDERKAQEAEKEFAQRFQQLEKQFSRSYRGSLPSEE
ncbi:phosphate signaling complex protein PhoU [Corynebacterium sp. sy017]|uniref:phosphate signaling complex protein PhoU n=1 Tax=unclassified Corynebacterium TaxID=2624378 RepID=UPI00118504B2|nr:MULTISPECIES: phosphate signaling complex protein PhoU [unclassified Corynebacterium]MBP3089203.1 phosphate signaling complex protein PhoU [Corynebacterium sp. sy017]TSD91089.1 phosphate signaling complex protein PhoU [Corynebacterium sp. SY003]